MSSTWKTTIDNAKAGEREFRRPQSYTKKNDRYIRNTQSERNNLSEERAQHFVFNNKYSALNKYKNLCTY